MKKKIRIENIIISVVMTLVSLTMLFPFVWMLSTSLKERQDAIDVAINLIPSPITFEAYKEVWEIVPLLSGFKNTLLIAIPEIAVGVICSALAAFAFAKMDIPFKNFFFMAILSTMMLPGMVTLIPQYVMWGKIGLTDSLIPLTLPGMLGNVSVMFFLRQFLTGIPDDYIWAAKIDGAGWMKTFWKIFFPLMKPGLAAQVIFWFMSVWNDFFGPLIYLDSENKQTLQLILRLLSGMGSKTMNFPVVMAGAVISCIPLLVVFISCQRYFMDSMVVSGVKG